MPYNLSMQAHSKLFLAAALAFPAGAATYAGVKSCVHADELQITKTGLVIETGENLFNTRIYDFGQETMREGLFLHKLENLNYSDVLKYQLVRRRACQAVYLQRGDLQHKALCAGMDPLPF